MKKIYIITDGYPFTSAGKSFMLPELRELAKRYDITLLSLGHGKADADLPKEVKYESLGEKCSNFTGLFYVIRGAFSPMLRREISMAKKDSGRGAVIASVRHFAAAMQYKCLLKKKIKKLGAPDILYSFWGNAPLTGAVLLRRESDKWLLVSRCHGYDLYRDRMPCNYQPFKKQVDEKIDAMFLVCRAGLDYYRGNWSVSKPEICRLSPLGSSNENGLAPYEKSDTLRLVSCSNIVPVKRLDMIIDALAGINDINIEWTHFGSGELEEKIKSRAEEKLGGHENISYRFEGCVDNTRLLEIYKERIFDCFITLSESEGGVPVSITEAASFGIPVIASAAGGIPEIAGNDNGILLSSGCTAADAAAAISGFYSLPDEKKEDMRKASREKWERLCRAEDNARRFAEMLENTVRREV